MTVHLPDLPYAADALEPHVSARTLEFHHGKHHAGYVKKLNDAIGGTDLEQADLPAIVQATAGDEARRSIFNKAAQAWNHTFLWHSMAPDGGGAPSGDIAAAIDKAFGGYDDFRDAFKAAALARFGSGWCWLVNGAGGLEVVTTLNAETPLVGPATPLLTLDVWEHAYYLDYQNDRGAYIDAFLDNLVNWEFAATNLAAA